MSWRFELAGPHVLYLKLVVVTASLTHITLPQLALTSAPKLGDSCRSTTASQVLHARLASGRGAGMRTPGLAQHSLSLSTQPLEGR
jgi:hypothetical protein